MVRVGKSQSLQYTQAMPVPVVRAPHLYTTRRVRSTDEDADCECVVRVLCAPQNQAYIERMQEHERRVERERQLASGQNDEVPFDMVSARPTAASARL